MRTTVLTENSPDRRPGYYRLVLRAEERGEVFHYTIIDGIPEDKIAVAQNVAAGTLEAADRINEVLTEIGE